MATISLADNGSTAVRHEASNSRIVSMSISPIRCSPAAVSWIAADKRLRYLPALFFRLIIIAKDLLQLRLPHRHCNLFVRVIQKVPGPRVGRLAAHACNERPRELL